VVGISVPWARGGYPSMVWVQLGQEAGLAEGWVSQWCMDQVRPKRWGCRRAWVCVGLWPHTAQGAESPAEPSSSSTEPQGGDLAGRPFFYYIVAWRSLPQSKCLECLCFWLSLELYLSQVCLHLLGRVSGSAHEVCSSVSLPSWIIPINKPYVLTKLRM
jgi:hypothetical protein